MNAAHDPHPGEFRPGDWVIVVGGTFVGSEGRVIDAKEAREMWERSGGQQPGYWEPEGCVWVALPVFGRPVPVMLTPDQLGHSTPDHGAGTHLAT
jgi:transcription antitermination factor NusG